MKTPFILLVALLFCQSCKIVPIQTGNVVIAETFRQSFVFNNEGSKIKNQDADKILKRIIGTSTFSELKENAGKTKQYKDIVAGNCESWGNAQIIISVIPSSIASKKYFNFFVSGNGRYFIYLKSDRSIYYSATLSIVQDLHTADELRQGLVVLKFYQQLTNHFSYDEGARIDRYLTVGDSLSKGKFRIGEVIAGLRDYRNEEPIETHIRLNTDLAADNIFSIDYEAKHEVWIGNDFIGYMEFEKPKYPINSTNFKLMDLRGIEYIRRDYEKLQKKAMKLQKNKPAPIIETGSKTQ